MQDYCYSNLTVFVVEAPNRMLFSPLNSSLWWCRRAIWLEASNVFSVPWSDRTMLGHPWNKDIDIHVMRLLIKDSYLPFLLRTANRYESNMIWGSLLVGRRSSYKILREYLCCQWLFMLITYKMHKYNTPIYAAMYAKSIRFQLVISINMPNKVRTLLIMIKAIY